MFTAFKVRTCIFCYKNKKHPHPISRDEGIVLPRYHPSSRKAGSFFSVTGEARSVLPESSKVKGSPRRCALSQPVKDISVPWCTRFAAFS